MRVWVVLFQPAGYEKMPGEDAARGRRSSKDRVEERRHNGSSLDESASQSKAGVALQLCSAALRN